MKRFDGWENEGYVGETGCTVGKRRIRGGNRMYGGINEATVGKQDVRWDK